MTAPTAGSTLPDLELPDQDGNVRRLSELVGGDPTLLHFYRGWWCPKDRQFFRTLLAHQDEAEVAYTRMVSVSVDPPAVQAAFRAGLGARWLFLGDPDRRYLDELALRETTDDVHHPYAPTVLVLLPDLTVHTAYDGYWYWGRPSLEQLRRDLLAVTAQVRGDLSRPT